MSGPTPAQIGERFRHARDAVGLTQQNVADAVGTSRASIANFEAGRQDVPLSKVITLCEAVGIGLDVLWSGPEPCPTCGCVWRGPSKTTERPR